MADHGVQRVDRPIREHAGSAGGGGPKRGRDDGVDGVLCHRLDDRAHDLGLVELRRLAPDKRRELRTSGFKVVPIHRGLYAQRGLRERASRHRDVRSRRGRAEGGTGGRRDPDANRRVRGPRISRVAVKMRLDPAHDGAEPGDGVRGHRRLTEQAVGHHARRGAERPAHHRAAATTRPAVSPTMPLAPSTSPVNPPMRRRARTTTPAAPTTTAPTATGPGTPGPANASVPASAPPTMATGSARPPRNEDASPPGRAYGTVRAVTAIAVRDAHHNPPRSNGDGAVAASAAQRRS